MSFFLPCSIPFFLRCLALCFRKSTYKEHNLPKTNPCYSLPGFESCPRPSQTLYPLLNQAILVQASYWFHSRFVIEHHQQTLTRWRHRDLVSLNVTASVGWKNRGFCGCWDVIEVGTSWGLVEGIDDDEMEPSLMVEITAVVCGVTNRELWFWELCN